MRVVTGIGDIEVGHVVNRDVFPIMYPGADGGAADERAVAMNRIKHAVRPVVVHPEYPGKASAGDKPRSFTDPRIADRADARHLAIACRTERHHCQANAYDCAR